MSRIRHLCRRLRRERAEEAGGGPEQAHEQHRSLWLKPAGPHGGTLAGDAKAANRENRGDRQDLFGREADGPRQTEPSTTTGNGITAEVTAPCLLRQPGGGEELNMGQQCSPSAPRGSWFGRGLSSGTVWWVLSDYVEAECPGRSPAGLTGGYTGRCCVR